MKSMGLFDYPTATTADAAGPRFTFLADLPDESWKQMLAIVETLHFRAGDPIIRQDERDEAFFILTSGELEVVEIDARGRERLINEIRQGAVFGEIGFFDGAPRTATVRGRTDGTAIRVTRKNFENLAAWHPLIARRILYDLGRILALQLR